MSDSVATQTRQAVAVDEVLDSLDYEVGNDDHIFYDTYSELHDMVSKLGYENAKLREVVSDGEESARLILDESRALQAENAKLRELCVSLYEFAMSEYPDGTELNFADRLRELGVEVDA